ncbi:MAG: hypothetical protein WC761_00345 [Candidatus Paceibacterota bacterium]|jgi:hypothetical protein
MKVGALFKLNQHTIASYNYRNNFTFGEVIRDETNTCWIQTSSYGQVELEFYSNDTYVLIDKDQTVHGTYKNPDTLHYIFFSIGTCKCFSIRIDENINPRKWLVELKP